MKNEGVHALEKLSTIGWGFVSRRAIFRPSGANIINVALNPSQYLYNVDHPLPLL